MIPTNPLFEAFLAEVRVVSEPPQGAHENLTMFGNSLRNQDRPDLYLMFPDSELQPASVIKAIRGSLTEFGCESDRAVAIAALAVVAETRPDGSSAVDHANACLADVTRARYRHCAVSPARPEPGYRVDFDDFVMEAFDPQNLLYWGERTQSRWPIDIAALRGHLAFTRKPCDVSMIAWKHEAKSCLIRKWGQTDAQTLLDSYYQTVNRFHERQFPEIIRDSVAILEAGAILLFDESFLEGPFIKRLGLFTWKQEGRHMGWALLSSGVLHINMLPEDAVAEWQDWLQSEFSFEKWTDDRPLDASIRSYARFMQRAWRHKHEARTDEAFLHFVISLDLLLGEQGQSTDSVCQRAAMLTSAQNEGDMAGEKRTLQGLYRARSKYVHEGRPVSDADLSSVERVCLEVLWTLLTARCNGIVDDPADWLGRIDFAAAAARAGQQVDEAVLRSVGIRADRGALVPPNRVQFLNRLAE